MKKFLPALLLLFICAVALNSCKKSSITPSNAISISLKINGTAKSTLTPVTDYIVSEQTLQIMGAFGTEGLSIMVMGAKVGTFDAAKDEAIMSYSTKADFQYTYIASTGTVTITSLTDTMVAGTFQFSGPDPSGHVGTVTEGKFNCKLYKQ